MDLTRKIEIKSAPKDLFTCLLNPDELRTWWQCHAVVEPKVGGVWALGWGEGEEGFGHAVVITGFIQELIRNSRLVLFIDPITITLTLEAVPGGALLSLSQLNYPEGQDAEASMGTWMSAMEALASHAQTVYPAPVEPPLTKEKQPIERTGQYAGGGAEQAPDQGAPQGVQAPMGARDEGHREAVQAAMPAKPQGSTSESKEEFRILEDGGFDVTDPWGVIKSWKKESGFGYVDHPELGDVMFDYDGCDFEPHVGDKVLLLRLKKTWNGKPKCKRIACPEKGSRVDK